MPFVYVEYRPCCSRIGGGGIGHLSGETEVVATALVSGEVRTIPIRLDIDLPGGDRVSDLRRCPFCGAAIVATLRPCVLD